MSVNPQLLELIHVIIDNVSVSIVLGIIFIVIYVLINKKIPDFSTAILLFISGQPFTYGLFFVLYSITSDITYLFEDRWMIGFGGFALLWVGVQGLISNLKPIKEEHSDSYLKIYR